MHIYNPQLKQLSQQLRRNMTDAENMLWSKLRMKQLKGFMFSRQKPIGGYIADFSCHRAKLVIEVDGAQHYSEDTIEYDKTRSQYFESLGITVLRFTNDEVMSNIDGVIDIIEAELT
jgi:very-short-patch-repair endonuclease